MNFGVTATAAALLIQAAKSTQQFVQNVQDAVEFDRVLAGGPSDNVAGTTSEPVSTQSLLESTVKAIQRRLGHDQVFSADADGQRRGLTFRLGSEGGLQLQSPSDRAAAIEASLGDDPVIKSLVQQLFARLGPAEVHVPRPLAATADQRASIVDLTH